MANKNKTKKQSVWNATVVFGWLVKPYPWEWSKEDMKQRVNDINNKTKQLQASNDYNKLLNAMVYQTTIALWWNPNATPVSLRDTNWNQMYSDWTYRNSIWVPIKNYNANAPINLPSDNLSSWQKAAKNTLYKVSNLTKKLWNSIK